MLGPTLVGVLKGNLRPKSEPIWVTFSASTNQSFQLSTVQEFLLNSADPEKTTFLQDKATMREYCKEGGLEKILSVVENCKSEILCIYNASDLLEYSCDPRKMLLELKKKHPASLSSFSFNHKK